MKRFDADARRRAARRDLRRNVKEIHGGEGNVGVVIGAAPGSLQSDVGDALVDCAQVRVNAHLRHR